jgi:hypothetical protein
MAFIVSLALVPLLFRDPSDYLSSTFKLYFTPLLAIIVAHVYFICISNRRCLVVATHGRQLKVIPY